MCVCVTELTARVVLAEQTHKSLFEFQRAGPPSAPAPAAPAPAPGRGPPVSRFGGFGYPHQLGYPGMYPHQLGYFTPPTGPLLPPDHHPQPYPAPGFPQPRPFATTTTTSTVRDIQPFHTYIYSAA